MLKAAFFPGEYWQGPGALEHLGHKAQGLGETALVVAGPKARIQGEQELLHGLAGFGLIWEAPGPECTREEVERLRQRGEKEECEFVVGFGGGKALDAAKATANLMDLPVLIAPSVAASPAASTGLAALYSQGGVFQEYLMLSRSPRAVLVDTGVVARCPARYLAAGMGHVLAARWEAEAAVRAGKPGFAGGTGTNGTMALAEYAYRTLLEMGEPARRAVEQNAAPPAVERVVEANLLLAGLVLESGGMATAHAVANGLTVLDPLSSRSLSGEKAAFGALVQLLLEDRSPALVYEMMQFCRAVDLPTCLEGLGLEGAGPEEIHAVARAATAEGETPGNQAFPVTSRMVYDAVRAADAWGRAHAASGQLTP